MLLKRIAIPIMTNCRFWQLMCEISNKRPSRAKSAPILMMRKRQRWRSDNNHYSFMGLYSTTELYLRGMYRRGTSSPWWRGCLRSRGRSSTPELQVWAPRHRKQTALTACPQLLFDDSPAAPRRLVEGLPRPAAKRLGRRGEGPGCTPLHSIPEQGPLIEVCPPSPSLPPLGAARF